MKSDKQLSNGLDSNETYTAYFNHNRGVVATTTTLEAGLECGSLPLSIFTHNTNGVTDYD